TSISSARARWRPGWGRPPGIASAWRARSGWARAAPREPAGGPDVIPIDLSGPVAIVTGGGRGVGRGISERLREAGADVVVCSRNEPAALPEAGGRRAGFVAADVRDVEQIARAIAFVRERFGRLDVLVNNAGGSPPAPAA